MMMESFNDETSQALGITCGTVTSLIGTSKFYLEDTLDVSVHTARFFLVFYSTHCDER